MRERLVAATGTLVDTFMDTGVYLASGLAALLLASLVSSHFMSRALSQETSHGAGPGAAAVAPAQQQHGPPATAPVQVAPAAPLPGQAPGQVAAPGQAPQMPAQAGAPGQGAGVGDPGLTATGVPTGAKSKVPSALGDVVDSYNYNPVGKRDPFMPYERPTAGALQGPLWPLQRFDLEQLKLVGIIWDVSAPKAMILDPSGKGYVVKVNERVGRNNGYVARIREGEIIVVESTTGLDGKLVYVTKLMKLQTE